ncbi:MAG TPA: VWA domain-containing protein [Candidatus Binatia bacterium]
MGFAEPLALLFAGLYGILVVFYLWERWRRRVAVPSLLLWEVVPEDTLRARRFRPDLLFLLQLLLLACLIAGLARPYFSDGASLPPRGRHVFVLDTSASMQAREARGTRFDEARGQALDLLKSLQADEEVMLITTAPSPEVLVNFTRERDAVAQALERLAPTDTGSDLSVALAFADSAMQRSDVPTELEVFSDIPRSQLPEPGRDHAKVFQVGETDVNIGIEALQIFQGRFQDYRRARAYVLVENFGHREGHGFLTVRLENQVVNRSGFTLPPRESKEFVVHGFRGPGRVVAQIEATDALDADNVAFGWIRPVRPVRLLLVSAASPLVDDLRQLVTATPALQLSVVDPRTFSADQSRQADLVIFNRFVPDVQPATNTLYLYPPRENTLFPVAGDAENIEVLDWDTHHPALQSLRPLAALPLQRARIVTPPAWSQVLLWSRTSAQEFPLALAGEDNGHRVACITFDLESEGLLGSDNLNFFLFFMNLLGWLAPSGEETAVVRTGEVTPLGPLADGPVRVQYPHGEVVTLPAGQATLQPLYAGEYRVSVDGTSRLLLANFFDPVESDIGRSSKEPTMPPQPATHGVQTIPASDRHEYGSWLYDAAAALLLFEWAVARRRSV